MICVVFSLYAAWETEAECIVDQESGSSSEAVSGIVTFKQKVREFQRSLSHINFIPSMPKMGAILTQF